MILNSLAVLDGSIAILRVIAGTIVVCLALLALRSLAEKTAGGRELLEDRYHLLSPIALLLLALNLLSWPLFYLLLQSYIPEWPGVMCIYGVMQIGAGSDGTSRFLPPLVQILQWLKPLVVFATGLWFTLYLANRQTLTGSITARVLFALLICGTLAIVDSGAELAYLGIPKKEEFQATGCCPLSSADRSQVSSAFNESDGRIVEAAFFATSLGMALALLQVSRNAILTLMASLALAAAGTLTFLVGREFLIEVGAPAALHLPYHHCPYDLIGGASETLLGIGAFAWGTLSVGWVCLASRCARDAETERVVPAIVGRIAFIGFCCYLSAASMAAVELTLA